MTRKKRLPSAQVVALRRFQEMLPVLLAEVATHGVAHLKLVRCYEGDDQPVQVALIDVTSTHLDPNERLQPRRVDQRMLKEIRES